MASENNPQALEQQDQSIKARKFQLFEEKKSQDGLAIKPFRVYVEHTPAAPLSPAIKASLWATGVLVVLLLLSSLLFKPARKRRVALAPASPAPVSQPAPVAGPLAGLSPVA